MPTSVGRYLTSCPQIEPILDLARFQPYRANICKPVSTAEVSGYWVCRDLWDKVQASDHQSRPTRKLTLFWSHGGAYVLGHALSAVASHIRIAEILASHGVKVDIFALSYSLGPDEKFPVQQQQAIAAYRHLVEVEKIDPMDIVVVGDSAGGHLALSFLLALQQPQQKALSKPGGAMLLYPWVNLLNSGASFERNKNKCMLVRSTLDQAVDDVVGGQDGRKRFSGLLNLAAPRASSDATWKEILPSRTWVNVGAHDLFLDDVQAFYRNAANDGATIELDVTKGKPHGWQAMDDKFTESTYTALRPGEAVGVGVMAGSENMASGLLYLLNKT